MKLLLDIHAFLWWTLDDERLSAPARSAIADENNDLFLSVASAWEIVLKYDLHKLELPEPPPNYIPTRLDDLNGRSLEIEMKHVLALQGIPMHHKDPFDRVIVVQSLVEQMPILTNDALIRQYGVQVIW